MTECTCDLCRETGRQLTERQHQQCRENPEFVALWKRHGEAKRMPSMARRAINAAGAIGRVAKAVVKRRPVQASAELTAARLAVCAACEWNQDGWCQQKRCGCWTQAKAALLTETCPAGFWPLPPPPES